MLRSRFKAEIATHAQPLNVVIIGGTRGFGNSLVRQFYKDGHTVFFTSREAHSINETVLNTRQSTKLCNRIVGFPNDVSTMNGIKELRTAVNYYMPNGVDVWINNAAISDNYTDFCNLTPERINQIITTNVCGSIISTHLALDVFHTHNEQMGHVFNVAGAGSDGLPTPQFSIYGCTKAAVYQFVKSIRKEHKENKRHNTYTPQVGLHIINPGMMPTDLLIENASPTQLQIFNILCEHPDVVAAYVSDEIHKIVKNNKQRANIEYMTVQRVLAHFLTFHKRKDRFWKTD